MKLKFHPHQTLQAAARIANEHGMELRVKWNGKQAVVETVKTEPIDIPMFLKLQAG